MSVETPEFATSPSPLPADATPPETGSVAPSPVATVPAPVEDVKPYTPPSEPTAAEDVERLVPSKGDPFALESGFKVVAKPLKLREFLGLLKIVTRGAALMMGSVRLNTDDEDFMQSMMSLFLFAIPEAEEEACDFIRMMVKPAGPFAAKEEEIAAEQRLWEELDNPELGDMVSIIETVIRAEGKDLRSLGKRLSSMLEVAQKTGQI